MKTKILFLLGIFFWVSSALADDTDVYGISNISVTPNVLIILDNSGSMSTKDVASNQSDNYDSATTYSGSYETDKVYVKKGGKWDEYFSDINSTNWQCATAQTELLSTGYWKGKLKNDWQNGKVNCSDHGSDDTYALGNFLNFGGGGDKRSRMEVAKEVVADLIYDNYSNVEFGLMTFNSSTNQGGYIVAGCGSTQTELIGTYEPDTCTMTDSVQSAYGAVGLLESLNHTPLAETLAEAGLYFAGKASWFNSGTTYTSPIEYRCQQTYIILVTDGEPTSDDDKFSSNNYIIDSKLTDENLDPYDSGYMNDENDSHYSFLDDVSYFLRHNDVSDLGDAGDYEEQTITTYTIGFQTEQELLSLTATRGGGEYYQASNSAELGVALNSIIVDITKQNEVFTAAAVPVSQSNKAYAGNFIYYGMFQPSNTSNWYGNLKKYYITNSGVIQDQNDLAIESNGTVLDNAVSYWSDSKDGPNVTAGGAGEVLQDRTTDRNIYTYLGTGTNLTEFSTDNATTLAASDASLTTTVIEAVHTGVSDDWPLGSLLHSRPLVVHYDDHSVIYVGANDGMLHCFDDDDGKELWGFIPNDLLGYLSLLESATGLKYFVDGTPVYYHYDHDNDNDASTPDKKLLIFGERRGGQYYTALDISDEDAPAFKYTISPDILLTYDTDTAAYSGETLGLSWAEPQALQMAYTVGCTEDDGVCTTDVFLMAGGYDTNQDLEPPEDADNMGRAVYAVDAQTGAPFSNFRFSPGEYSAMTHSIIAVSGFENPKSRTTTRVYAGDMNGNLFAFRDDIFDHDAASDYQEDGVWGQKLKLYAVPGRKIFYAPTILNEYFPVEFTYTEDSQPVTTTENRIGDYVFFGTGDREHPERTDIVNGFYAIKNSWQWLVDSAETETPAIVEAYINTSDGTLLDKEDNQAIGDDELFILDVTDDLFQSDTTAYVDYVKAAINHENNRGWFFLLEDKGEKVVSSPMIYDGVIYFSTYVPDAATADDDDDPCGSSGAGGNGYLYAIGYEYGGAAIDFDEDDDLQKDDRRMTFDKKGIPPEVDITVHEDATTIISGFQTVPSASSPGVERMYWRQLEREL